MKVVSLSPGRHVTMLCDKLVFAAGLTSEPNMPEISGLNWTAGSMLHNVHAKDVGEYCRGHLGYHPVLDRFQRRRELEHIMNSTRCVLWRYTRQISLCLIFFICLCCCIKGYLAAYVYCSRKSGSSTLDHS